jgi:hypothetical protein
MTMHAVLAQPTFRHEHGDEAKAAHLRAQSLLRWEQLRWTYEARKLNMRRAAARARRLAVR